MSHGTTILMELFAVFVWAKVFAEVFEQIGIPAVLGEITAGALLGPHAFNLVNPSEFTFSIAEVGAVFLLLSVGLETRPQDLIRVGGKSLGVALGGVVLPFATGFGYILWRGYSPHEATFVAAAMVATSVAVTARVLRDMGKLSSQAARIILGAAVFDDILGMLVLAIVAGLATTGTIRWLQLSVLSVEAAGFAVVMIFVAPRLIHRIRTRIEDIHIPHAPVFLVMGLGLGLSAAAEKIGLAAIIGAFFAGLAFADYGDEWGIRPRIEGIADFLAPFFFFTIGTQLDPGVFSSRSLVTTAAVVSVLAIFSKLLGCGLPVLRNGWKTGLQVGFGMVPRGEVGFIVAALGLRMKLISDASYAVVVAMVMFTTIVTPPLLKTQFREPLALPAAKPPRSVKAFLRFMNPFAGLVVCACLAGVAAFFFQGKTARDLVPTAFLIIVVIAAKLWGRLAGVLGTLAGALAFSFFLFNPLGTWMVENNLARANLGWMILAGMILSHFLGKHETLKQADAKGS
jgi:Kef-type K+ transport system membrane component KefB